MANGRNWPTARISQSLLWASRTNGRFRVVEPQARLAHDDPKATFRRSNSLPGSCHLVGGPSVQRHFHQVFALHNAIE